jgi:histidyl-tRNA synthetase
VFVIDASGGDGARDVSDELRLAGVAVDRAYDGRSFKAQMKLAMRSGARFAVVVDADGSMQLRTLADKGEPEPLTADDLVEHVQKRLG